MLFPLPLTAFEKYMLFDDRPDQPMVFYLQLNFFGGLDRSAFEQSLRNVLVRHPLFQTVVNEVDGSDCFVHAEHSPPHVIWDDQETSGEANCFINLREEVGLRIRVTHDEEQARVLFTFHHCCTDGVGAVQFIEDLLADYTAELSPEYRRPELRPVNRSLLAGRGRHGLNWFGRLLRFPLDLLALVGIAQFFGNRPAAIESKTESTLSAGSALPHSVSRRISQARLADLKTAAKRAGVTLNDLLIRDLLLAIDAWNARHNAEACGRCLRVSVPVNLRLPADAELPATNVVSMVFVDRRVKATTKAAWLLKSIRIDTWFIKRFRLALVFTWIVEALGACRGGFAKLLSREGSLATAVLSNLGTQFHDLPLGYLGNRVIVGDALLDSITFLPPVRRGTNAALGVVTYGGELMVSMQFAPAAISRLLADDLLRLFDEQLAISSGDHSAAPQALPFQTVAPRQEEPILESKQRFDALR